MTRVAFLCAPGDRLNPDSRTSVAIVAAHLAREVAAAGNEVTIIAPDADAARSDPDLAAIELVKVRPPNRRAMRLREFVWGQLRLQPPFLLSDGYFPSEFRARLMQALKKAAPDIVHVPTFGQYLREIAQALPAARIVLHLHDELWGHLPAALGQRQLRPAAQILCVNAHIHGVLTERVPALSSRISVLHNGVDAPSSDRTMSPSPGTPRLVYVGRLSPEKGLHILADAVGLLYSKFPDLKVDLVGSPGLIPWAWLGAVAADDPICATLQGFYGSNLVASIRRQLMNGARRYVDESIARSGAARDCLRLHGFVPHQAIQQFFASATAVVCPSVCSEISMSAYEGMAVGLPAVISYDRPCDGAIVHRETALVVPRSDPVRLAAALEELLADAALSASLGLAARARILADFTWAKAGERLLDVYGRL